VRYYVLTVVKPESRLATSADLVAVRLDRLTVPTELDRAELLQRMDATRIQLLEDDRWAAPLDDMIRRVLTADLAARLPADRVADPNEPAAGERRQSLAVDIQRFDGDSACVVTLRAAWVLKPPDGSSQRGSEETHVASGNCAGAASLPVAMSQALAQLSDHLAALIAGSAGGGSPGTPH
jgi:hypothetical protein